MNVTATATVTLSNDADAVSLGALLARLGDEVTVNGRTVTLDADALNTLADLDDEHDGHFDGTYVWVGGTEYVVSSL